MPCRSPGRPGGAAAASFYFQWFGYKLHLLVDVRHEGALAYHISDTKLGDNESIEALVEQAEGNLGAGRIEALAYYKAGDYCTSVSYPTHRAKVGRSKQLRQRVRRLPRLRATEGVALGPLSLGNGPGFTDPADLYS